MQTGKQGKQNTSVPQFFTAKFNSSYYRSSRLQLQTWKTQENNKQKHAQQANQAQATIALALLTCQHVNNSKACTVTAHGS